MTFITGLFISAWLSYKALFTWLNPWGYISTRLLAPVLTGLLFCFVSAHEGNPIGRQIAGGAVLAIAASTIFGLSMAVNNERMFGTLIIRATTPERVLAPLLSKAVPHIIDGWIGGLATLLVSCSIFEYKTDPVSIVKFLVVCIVACFSCLGLALVGAAIGLVSRDTFTFSAIVDALVLLLSGAVVAPTLLPRGIGIAADIIPLHYTVGAGYAALSGQQILWSGVFVDIGIATFWLIIGVALLMRFYSRSRVTGSLDLL